MQHDTVVLVNTVYLHKCTDENSNSSSGLTCNYTAILLDMPVVYCAACLKATTNTGVLARLHRAPAKESSLVEA